MPNQLGFCERRDMSRKIDLPIFIQGQFERLIENITSIKNSSDHPNDPLSPFEKSLLCWTIFADEILLQEKWESRELGPIVDNYLGQKIDLSEFRYLLAQYIVKNLDN